MELEQLKSKIEAVLFTTARALEAKEIAEFLGEDVDKVEEALVELIFDYASRDGALEIDDERIKKYLINVKKGYLSLEQARENAVYYDNKARLKYFKDRFADCHYFIMPDCSLTYDQDTWDIIFRTALMRLTCLWLTFELKAHVVPLITYGIDDTFNLMITGLKECETVAFSLKGSLLEKYKEEQLKRVIKYTVDNLHNLCHKLR